MTPTNSRSSRESIALRAVIVLSLLCVAAGGAMIYIGSNNARFWHEEWKKEMDKQQSPAFNECFKAALRAHDAGDQIKLCYDVHGANIGLLRMWQDKVNAAQSIESLGIVLSVLPVPMFALFFVLCWILTGRWKRDANAR